MKIVIIMEPSGNLIMSIWPNLLDKNNSFQTNREDKTSDRMVPSK